MKWRLAFTAAVSLALALVVGATASSAKEKANGPRVALTLPETGSYPEGIAVDPTTKRVYVTSLTDGSIFVANRLGQTMKTFSSGGADGRTSAVGIVAAGKRVIVAGGQSGRLYAYNQNAELMFVARTPDEGSFLNDIAVSDGYAYVTDSFRPLLWRVPLSSTGEVALEPWLDLSMQGVTYQPNTFNWNGIEQTSAAGVLIAVDSSSGSLYRIDVRARKVTKIDLASGSVRNGDGLVVRGQSVWVVRNSDQTIDLVTMNADWSAGSVVNFITSTEFGFPTTADLRDGQLLVVNSQFDKGGPAGPGEPTRPFTVSSVRLKASRQ